MNNPRKSLNNTNDMTFIEHVNELRKYLLYSLIALSCGMVFGFICANQLIGFLAIPIGGFAKLQSIEVTESIGIYMRVSLFAGFILAFPVILMILLNFITPGLKSNEKKWLYISLPMVLILFLGGVAFTYFVLLPVTIPYLISFLELQTLPSLCSYINFVTNIMFWIGCSFEMPLIFFISSKLGLVTAKQLASQWRIAIFLISILAAVITPTVDPVNMGLMMLPLFLLYILSIFFAQIGGSRRLITADAK